MTEWDADLTDRERVALATLREDVEPPAELEEAVVGELARRGLVRPAAAVSRRWLPPLAAVIGIALFGLGVLVGSRTARSAAAPAGSASYVLFLEGADTPTPEEETQRVAEYRTWARQQAGAGRLVAGEKLELAAQALGAEARSAGAEAVRGFFIILAKDDAEALAIARGCPHLRHGGRVVVRRVART